MSQGLLFALFSLLLYGVWGFSYKMLSIKGIQGEWAVALVMFLGAAISAAIALTRSSPFPLGKVVASSHWLLLIALCGAVGNIFLIKAMAVPGFHSGVALAVSGAYPLVAALLAYFLLGEQLAGYQAVGIAAIVFGVGLLTFK